MTEPFNTKINIVQKLERRRRITVFWSLILGAGFSALYFHFRSWPIDLSTQISVELSGAFCPLYQGNSPSQYWLWQNLIVLFIAICWGTLLAILANELRTRVENFLRNKAKLEITNNLGKNIQNVQDDLRALLTNRTTENKLVLDLDRMRQVISKVNALSETKGADFDKALREVWDNIADYSKLLYRCFLLERYLKDDDENKQEVKLQSIVEAHAAAQKIILFKAGNVVSLLLPLLTFGCSTSLAILLLTQGRSLSETWFWPVVWLTASGVVAVIVFALFDIFVRALAEQTETDLDDIFVALLAGPVSALSLLLGAYLFFYTIPQTDRFDICSLTKAIGDNSFVKGGLILVLGWLSIFVFNRLIVYALERWAEHTEQHYDDMFVRIIQLFGTFILVALIIGLELTAFQDKITELTKGENILLPYSIIVSTFGALLGYATREGIENFFGGILLQVDKPFQNGDRIQVDDHLCDVQEVGMRSTRLYDINDSVEVSIPNSKIATQTIVNFSRPDLSLRLSKIVRVKSKDFIAQVWAEGLMLELAYQDEEIDQMRIKKGTGDTHEGSDVPNELRLLGRQSMEELIEHLKTAHPEVKTFHYRSIQGNNLVDKLVIREIDEILKKIKTQRDDYNKIILPAIVNQDARTEAAFRLSIALKADGNKTDKEIWGEVKQRYGDLPQYPALKGLLDEYQKMLKKRSGILEQINSLVEQLEQMLMVVAESVGYQPAVKALIEEARKEPRVFSEAVPNLPEIRLQLRCFATYMGRRDGVSHQLEKNIRRIFTIAGIPFEVEDSAK